MKKLVKMVQENVLCQARYADISSPKSIFKVVTPIVFVFGGLIILFAPLSLFWKLVLVLPLLLLSVFIPYAVIILAADKRKNEIEAVFPDALLLMSANIRSGLTIDKALLVSARDEFGPLAKEVKKASMEIFGGSPVETALNKMKERTQSNIFKEVIKLIVDGIRSGGEISGLLESSAKDIRKTLLLRKEISANVKMYIMFITMASVVGAPLLFGISTYLIETTNEVWSGQVTDVPQTEGAVFTVSAPAITPEFFQMFAVIAIAITNLFAALIISEIRHGSIKNGFKSIPIYLIISLVVFFLIRIGVAQMVGAFIA